MPTLRRHALVSPSEAAPRRPLARAALVAAALAAAAPRPVRADCAQPSLGPVVLTTRDTRLPEGGGVLVGWSQDVSRNAVDLKDDPSNLSGAQATSGGAPAALTRASLAPGLSVYRAAGAGPLVLMDRVGVPLGTFTRDGQRAAPMPAPRPTSLLLEHPRVRYGESTRATLTLAEPPPAGAAAIVLYRRTKAGPRAIAFALVPDAHDGLTSLEVFSPGGHCTVPPPGTEAPVERDRVAFAWVDAFGRTSPVSAPVVARPAPKR